MGSDHIIRGRNSDSRAHLKERQITFVVWGVGGGGGGFFSGRGGQDCHFLGGVGEVTCLDAIWFGFAGPVCFQYLSWLDSLFFLPNYNIFSSARNAECEYFVSGLWFWIMAPLSNLTRQTA